MGRSKSRGPKHKATVTTQKHVKSQPMVDYVGEHPIWRFAMFDHSSKWPLPADAEKLVEIIKKLGNHESQTWAQIKSTKKSHFVAIHKLIKPAQDRLADLSLDDLESLFSLRLSGTERIWGILESNILKILWWDPEHEICPSHLRNT